MYLFDEVIVGTNLFTSYNPENFLSKYLQNFSKTQKTHYYINRP